MRRLGVVLLILAALLFLRPVPLSAADAQCLTRDQAITLIAHKADIENPGVLRKEVIWAISDRESGLQNCWPNGSIKVSPTGDRGLLQMNQAGVYRNCRINRYCNDLSKISDPYVQVDIILEYYRIFRDLCPWNVQSGARGFVNYNPGCGYQGPGVR